MNYHKHQKGCGHQHTKGYYGGLVGILGGVTQLATVALYGGSSIIKNIVEGALWGDHRSHSHDHHHSCGACCCEHDYTVECVPHHNKHYCC